MTSAKCRPFGLGLNVWILWCDETEAYKVFTASLLSTTFNVFQKIHKIKIIFFTKPVLLLWALFSSFQQTKVLGDVI